MLEVNLLKIGSKVALTYPHVHLVQRCDGDMDFEALLIHTRQEVALDLDKKLYISYVNLMFYLLVIELIEAKQVIKADNLVILKHG